MHWYFAGLCKVSALQHAIDKLCRAYNTRLQARSAALAKNELQ